MFWLTWRPVVEGVATLDEIENYYSMSDIWKLNALLDAKQDAERRAIKKAENK